MEPFTGPTKVLLLLVPRLPHYFCEAVLVFTYLPLPFSRDNAISKILAPGNISLREPHCQSSASTPYHDR
jgi:hypothetical protein